MLLTPSTSYRRAFKEGMRGWDVAVLQIVLNSHRAGNMAVDGVFGVRTKEVVIQEQQNHHLEEDGIAGNQFQRALCITEAGRAEATLAVPRGMLRGLIEGESGYMLAATTSVYANGTYDLGALQNNTPVGNQVEIERAFNLRQSCRDAAVTLVDSYQSFYGRPGARDARRAWELAVCNHNWPAAAANLARGLTDWTYWVWETRSGQRVKVSYRFTEPAPWIKNIGVAGVDSGKEWVEHYIHSKLLYVRW